MGIEYSMLVLAWNMGIVVMAAVGERATTDTKHSYITGLRLLWLTRPACSFVKCYIFNYIRYMLYCLTYLWWLVEAPWTLALRHHELSPWGTVNSRLEAPWTLALRHRELSPWGTVNSRLEAPWTLALRHRELSPWGTVNSRLEAPWTLAHLIPRKVSKRRKTVWQYWCVGTMMSSHVFPCHFTCGVYHNYT